VDDGVGGGAPSELGAELFALVARARAAGLDPELELRAAARAYRDRVLAWEEQARSR
jgi:XTP/dITP diphosphohydrolase